MTTTGTRLTLSRRLAGGTRRRPRLAVEHQHALDASIAQRLLGVVALTALERGGQGRQAHLTTAPSPPASTLGSCQRTWPAGVVRPQARVQDGSLENNNGGRWCPKLAPHMTVEPTDHGPPPIKMATESTTMVVVAAARVRNWRLGPRSQVSAVSPRKGAVVVEARLLRGRPDGPRRR